MDLRRFENNWLGALARFERMRDAFIQQFTKPLGEDLMLALLASMTPEQARILSDLDPANMEAVISKLTKGGLNGRE